MKFLTNIIQISSCLSQNLADPYGAPNILEPSHRLFSQYSKLHNQLPINDDPNNVYLKQGILVGEDEMNVLSTFSQEHLYLRKEDIPHAYGCGLYLQLLSEYERSQNRISESKGHDIDVEGRLSKHHNGTWSPILYDSSNYLSNENFYGIQTFHKTKTFIETKVAAMKLQGFNH